MKPRILSAARLSFPLTAAIAASFCLVFTHQTQATDYWWDSNGTTEGFGNATGIWGTSAFWSASNAGTATPAAAETSSSDGVNFGTSTLNYANGTVGIAAGGVTVNSIVYGTAQRTPINLGTAGNTLTLAGTTATITVNNTSATHNIISPVAASVELTKAGNGILVLSGTNTYNGGTIVSAGTLGFLNLASKPPLGTHAFGAGTTLGLGVGGAGFTAADVDNAFAGNMTGNLSDVTVAATTSIGIDTTAGNLTYTVPGSPGRGLTKLGANTLTLIGTSRYTGPTTIQAGTLSYDTAAAVGPGALSISIGAKAKLNYLGDRLVASLALGGTTMTVPGSYGSVVSGAHFLNDIYFSGIGTVTIPPPTITAPTLTGIADDKSGGPITVNTLVTYTVAFSEDMNHTTVTAADFGNAGDATVTIGLVVETTPGIFTVPVTPTSAGKLRLQVLATAELKDTAGNILDTATAIPDDTQIIVNAAYAAWIGGPFAATFTDTNPALDFDGGSLPTGIEWVVGGDPTKSSDDAGLAPTIDTTTDPNDKFRFIYRRSDAANLDPYTTVVVEYGDVLTRWTAAIHQGTGAGDITISEVPADPGFSEVTVALPGSLAVSGKLFVRLKVVVAIP